MSIRVELVDKADDTCENCDSELTARAQPLYWIKNSGADLDIMLCGGCLEALLKEITKARTEGAGKDA